MSSKIYNNELTWLSDLKRLILEELPPHSNGLFQAANHHFKKPGKFYRAQLAIKAGQALGLNKSAVLNWAAACEMIHNASLVHDDISDASTHRRGQNSVTNHFGQDTAICLGDWLVAKAFELAADNPTCGGQLVSMLSQAMQVTCDGQVADLTVGECLTLQEWKMIAADKTVPFLLAPIKGMAVMSGLEDDIPALTDLVLLTGLAYQGRNDIDDIIPSSHTSVDLLGRKPNLVVSLFHKHSPRQKDFASWYFSGDTTKINNWQRTIASSDVVLQANIFVEDWLDQADELRSNLSAELQPACMALIEKVRGNMSLASDANTA